MSRRTHLLLAWLLVMGFFSPGQTARASTTAGGPILVNTTWSSAGSPYLVSSSINVYAGVTLTIEAGTQVRMGPGTKLLVNGRLIVAGTSADPVVFTSDRTVPAPGDWDKIEFSTTSVTTTVGTNGEYLGGSRLRGCVVEYAGGVSPRRAVDLSGILMEDCVVRSNLGVGINATARAAAPSWISGTVSSQNESGVAAVSSYLINSTIRDNLVGVRSTTSIVRNNLIVNNDGPYDGFCRLVVPVGLSMVGGEATGNQIVGNWATCRDSLGAGLYQVGGIAEHNWIANNIASGIGGSGGGTWVDTTQSSTFRYNTVVGNVARSGSGVMVGNSGSYSSVTHNIILDNVTSDARFSTGGLDTYSVQPLHYNSIYSNSPQDVGVTHIETVDGTLNFFGTSDSAAILARIHDFYDDTKLGEFRFTPFLTAPEPTAPLAPPTDIIVAPQADGTVVVSWTPNPVFVAGWSHRLYYNTTGVPPFDGKGLTAGNSPINVGSATTLVLAPPFPAFVAVSTVDGNGRESWPSAIAPVIVNYAIHLPSLRK